MTAMPGQDDAAAPPESDDDAAPTHTNRLADETSPYLLQHAHNPVDWYPWGEEAFEKARTENKLIFLSVGYSTCYWCHVMERESFENEAIAAIMNEHYVCIKVDREERPDVDDIYMAAVQLFTQGAGGWPMSVWLEPKSLRPVYGGTYYPPEPRGRMPGFPQVLEGLAEVWKTRPDEMLQQAEQVATRIQSTLDLATPVFALSEEQVLLAAGRLLEIYDATDGGFVGAPNRAPKFPQPVFIELLLAARDVVGPETRDEIDAAIRHTLDRMATGGMYDQIGGGFHRYSTDEKWLVPHFEKMLYDNGQLASLYTRAFLLYDDPYYAEIVRETLEYVLREMTDSGGGFYSAQDAEVNAREGQNYLWSPEEMTSALAGAGLESEAEFAQQIYGIDLGTNFRDPHHPGELPTNVVYLVDRPDRLAETMSIELDEFQRRVTAINAALLAVRDTRDQPGLDDKILTAWNGLMIAGFAEAGSALNEERYVQAARDAADFILTTMRDADGNLLRSYRGGQAKVGAFLEDYAMLIRGLLALHEATGEAKWMDESVRLAAAVKSRFEDAANGAYYDTLTDQSDLFVRTKSLYDGAMPSGNSIMLLNLADLHERTGDEVYLDDAAHALAGLSGTVSTNPVGIALSTLALTEFIDKWPDRLPVAAAVTTTPPEAVTTPVRVTPSVETIVVPSGRRASFNLIFLIEDGYHVNAHEPGQPDLIGLDVQLTGGEGWTLAVDYPEGELYQDEIRIHAGTLHLPVSIERSESATGTPQLEITWQTCTDTECLEPTTENIPIETGD